VRSDGAAGPQARYSRGSNETRRHFTGTLQDQVDFLAETSDKMDVEIARERKLIQRRQAKTAVASGRNALKMAIGNRALKVRVCAARRDCASPACGRNDYASPALIQ
jgi:hypothetical protein